MNEYDDIDSARAALISQRIGQTFNFTRDVIDDPRTLEVIPSGSMLTFRDIEIPGHQIRLVAYRVPGTEARWAARITGLTAIASASDQSRHGFMISASIESGKSAEAALDVFEELIHAIIRLSNESVHQTA